MRVGGKRLTTTNALAYYGLEINYGGNFLYRIGPRDCSTLEWLLALPTNCRLGWKGLSGTNTLAYFENPVNYGRKKFNETGLQGMNYLAI